MSRRSVALVLLAVGSFALAVAVMLPTVLAPALVRLPADQPETSVVASGSGVTVLDLGSQQERRNVSVETRTTLVGQPAAVGVGPQVAVWRSGSVTADVTGPLVSVGEQTVCIDRRTGAAVNPCAAALRNGVAGTRFEGQVYMFPFHTEQRDYDLWDGALRRAVPARFAGTEQVDGTEVYRFEATIPETVTATREVPGRLAGGAPGTTVRADLVYSNVRTLWVEPTSGLFVRVQEQQRQVLRGPTGEGVTVFDGTVGIDDAGAAAALQRALGTAAQIRLVETVLPLVAVAVGLVFLAGGGVLLVRGRRASLSDPRREVGDDAPTSEMAGTRG